MLARDNPFSTDRVLAVRYRPQGWEWPALLERLAAMQFRAAIVGPRGSGKTTLLEDLCARLESRGRRCRMIRLSTDSRRVDAASTLRPHDILILDGAEQLSALHWALLRWQTRGPGGLIITTHAPGQLPTLLETRTTPQLLAGIVADLIPAPPDPREIETLYHAHRGNLRDALRALYDRFGGESQTSTGLARPRCSALESS